MIIDCFTFFNELDLLEIRLNTLDPYVDKFVLIESEATFQGKWKPLHYWENRLRYSDFHDKIIRVVAPLPQGETYEDGWVREHASRNAINFALEGMPGDTVILLSDLDEIPNLEGWDPATETPAVWSHRLFYYFVNMEIDRIKGTVATTLDNYRDNPQILGHAQKLRDWRHYNVDRVFGGTRGGWHFSYLGGIESIKEKINAFAHAELLSHATDENLRAALNENWKENVDLFHRKDLYKFRLIDDDASLPPYLVANKERFQHLWKPTYGIKELT